MSKCKHTTLNRDCPSCQSLQQQWYKRAEKHGFRDIEDSTRSKSVESKYGTTPIKKWSGDPYLIEDDTNPDGELVNIIDYEHVQSAEGPIQSSWPEPVFDQESEFIYHSEFKRICLDACSHGNSSLTPQLVEQIWQAYVDGGSERSIAKRFDTTDATVHRIIHKLTDAMNLLGNDIPMTNATVITRVYNPDSDNPFIFSTWRNALWYDQKRDNGLSDQFYRDTNRQIKKILPSSTIKIACLSDDSDQIVGYSVMNGSTVVFAYVKADYRKQGVARLLTKGYTSVLPSTKISMAFIRKENYGKKA